MGQGAGAHKNAGGRALCGPGPRRQERVWRQLARRARAVRRFSARRSSSDIPPHTPAS